MPNRLTPTEQCAEALRKAGFRAVAGELTDTPDTEDDEIRLGGSYHIQSCSMGAAFSVVEEIAQGAFKYHASFDTVGATVAWCVKHLPPELRG